MRKSPYNKNRKKRNLEYIRFKNRLNKFEPFISVTKFSNILDEETKYKEFTAFIQKSLNKYKKYKIEKFICEEKPVMTIGDDFYRNIQTWAVVFTKTK